jgi:hypothetical protein
MNPREDVASDSAPADCELDLADLKRKISEACEESKRKSRPGADLRIYCDRHLGTEMVRSRSYGLAREYDYGEPKADVWVMDYWRCQQPGCDRCYDASVTGYFSKARTMGSRIQCDTPGQKRCGQHDFKGPAMYIGKVGHGRRLFCPFYKCGEQGEVIAEIVIDSQVGFAACRAEDQQPGNAMGGRARSI